MTKNKRFISFVIIVLLLNTFSVSIAPPAIAQSTQPTEPDSLELNFSVLSNLSLHSLELSSAQGNIGLLNSEAADIGQWVTAGDTMIGETPLIVETFDQVKQFTGNLDPSNCQSLFSDLETTSSLSISPGFYCFDSESILGKSLSFVNVDSVGSNYVLYTEEDVSLGSNIEFIFPYEDNYLTPTWVIEGNLKIEDEATLYGTFIVKHDITVGKEVKLYGSLVSLEGNVFVDSIQIFSKLTSDNETPVEPEEPPVEIEPEENPQELAPIMDRVGDIEVPDRYIVLLKDDQTILQTEDSIESLVTSLGGELIHVYKGVLNGFSAVIPEESLLAYQQNPAIKVIYPDEVFHISDDVSDDDIITRDDILNQSDVDGDGGNGIQADYRRDYMQLFWGKDRIDQANYPLDQIFYRDHFDDAYVNVYIVDTGIEPHADLFYLREGFDAIDGTNGKIDPNGHGTHVAGIAVGEWPGVAMYADVYPVRVLDASGFGYTSDIVAGLDWIFYYGKDPAVVNISIEGPASGAFDAAVNNLINVGFTVVVAAGNDDDNACNYSPARVPRAITVGATDNTDRRASFSNFGSCVDIFAPGVDIWSSSNSGYYDYVVMNGTSMAAPFVTGVVAMYLGKNQTASPSVTKQAILAYSTKDLVKDPKGSPNKLLYSRIYQIIPTTYAPTGDPVYSWNPIYSWKRTKNATKFSICLYKSYNGDNVECRVVESSSYCSSTICSTRMNPLPEYTEYYWNVEAFIDGNWTGLESQDRYFYPVYPIVTTVSPKYTIYTNNPDYQWEPIQGASHYQLALYKGSNLLKLLTVRASNVCGSKICKTKLLGNLSPGLHFWTVKAYIGDWMEPSDYMFFSVAESPKLLRPSGTIYTSRPSHEWEPLPYATNYQALLFRGSTLVGQAVIPASNCSSTLCKVALSDKCGPGLYSWKVRAYINGAWYSYSNPMFFTVSNIPGLISPSGTIYTRSPIYKWRTLYGASNYQIQLFKGSTMLGYRTVSSSVCNATVCSVSLPYTLANGTYSFRVMAYVNGAWGNFSPNKAFYVSVK